MNCKPGDLAITIDPCPHPNRLVEVLHRAPAHMFKLPSGALNHGETWEPLWVIHTLDGPVDAFMSDGSYERTWYGCVPDRLLRPIRPGDETLVDTPAETTS